jgi:hypothetical protein
MKRIVLTQVLFLLIIAVFAQSPDFFNYQVVVRNSSGELIQNQDIGFQFTIIEGSALGVPVYTETHLKQSNSYGLCNLKIGDGTSGPENFSDISWGENSYFLKVEIDTAGGSSYEDMGTFELLSVPYALHANTASNLGNENIYVPQPDTLFVVKDQSGNVVFAVFPDGVKVIVEESSKGTVGGFAVSGRSPTKAGETDIFRVTPDSTRIYINDTIQSKGTVGGFAVSGRSPTKGFKNEYFVTTPDSTRIYVNDSSLSKGTVGGFAVSGRSPTKSGSIKFMDMTKENYFVGHESGKNNVDGRYNSFMGYQSGQANSSGNLNAFYGYQAGFSNISGSNNTFLGDSAGYLNTNGDYNTFIGFAAGSKNTSGTNNTFVGSYSGYNNADGDYNTFGGYHAGYANITGNENSFYGDRAGVNNIDGSNNVFIGNLTGFSNSGDSCVFIGNRSGYINEGIINIFIGNRAGYSNTTGEHNIFQGQMAGYKNETGNQNIFFGYKAGYKNISGWSNVFMGLNAGYSNETAAYGIFIGQNTGFNNNGHNNIFIGYSAGIANTSGSGNTFIGKHAGQRNQNGGNNIFIGLENGTYNVSGSGSVFLGNWCGTNSTGGWNTFNGFYSGQSNTSGYMNVFMGYSAGRENEDGNENVYLGKDAGYYNESGDYNVCIGSGAGNGNIFPSYTASNNIMIGYKAGFTERSSNRLYIESSQADSSEALIYGRFDDNWVRINDSLGIGINPNGFALAVEGDVYKTDGTELWNITSDRRIKTDIRDIENPYETLLKLRPVKYKFTKEWMEKHPALKDQYYYNFIAQEYQQVFPESVSGSGEYLEGDPNEILIMNGQNAQIVTVKAVQELIKENKELRQMILDLKKEVDKLKSE